MRVRWAGVALLVAGCAGERSAATESPPQQRPATPLPLLPGNGAYTGSPHARHGTPLRPVFLWAPIQFEQPVHYEIQLTDECVPGELQRCLFASPIVAIAGLPQPQWQPSAPLPAGSKGRPVGRRYYWRVRACAANACSAWSRVRYTEVGRTAGDLDGDGYSDVVVAAPLIDGSGSDRGAIFIYYGGPGGVGGRGSARVDAPGSGSEDSFGVSAAVAGDTNADGYADLIVGAAGTEGQRGVAYIFLGSDHGVTSEPNTRLHDRAGKPQDWYGAAVAGAGDVNGDGYADVVVGASGVDHGGVDWGITYVYTGGPRGPEVDRVQRMVALEPRDFDHFGFALARAGDVNSDGYADLVIGSPGLDLAGPLRGVDRGAAYVFPGGPDGPSSVPLAHLEAPTPQDHDRFGFAVSGAGDVDGDGYDDIAIGAPGTAGITGASVSSGGAVYLFRGGNGGPDRLPATTLEDPRSSPLARFGISVSAAGDVNGDGLDDIVVGASGVERGRGLVFHGNREGVQLIPQAVLHDPLGAGYNHFADAVAGAGDVDGNGFDDVIVGASGADNGGVFRGSAVVYPGSVAGIRAGAPLRVDNPDTGVHDHFGHVVAGR